MSDRTAAASQAAERRAKPRRGGPSGRQVVGDYAGQPASDAAQAVRRAGLRPGLDRSFGCAPELVGQVVAQEPPAGSDLARNGLVTLYVAAPGVAELASDEHPAPVTPTRPAAPDAHDEDAPSCAEPRRRRKQRRGARTRQVFDTPPAPVPPGEERPGEAPAHEHEAGQTEEWDCEGAAEPVRPDREPAHEEPAGELPGDELTHEEFVVHVDDLFAGRGGPGDASPAWRRVYPRRGLRARQAEHPWLFGIVGAMLAVWVVVGVAAALVGHSPSANHAGAPRPILKHGAGHSIDSGRPSPSRRPAVHSTGAAAELSRRRAAPRPAPSARRVPVRGGPAAPRQTSAPVAVAPRAAPAPVTSPPTSTPAPVAGQAGGGPFSP
ncbi:MAG TPA: PASTA domain-containing protein [Solirubrobacteraceae bacterium]|nr:PASTA domain-containing protein [Solirubrobacteraceae bacterium]